MFRSIVQSYKNLPISPVKLVLFCMMISIFFVVREYTNHVINQYNYPFSWFYIIAKILINYFFWFLLSPLAYLLTQSFQSRSNRILNIIIAMAGVVALSIFHRIAVSRTDDLIYYFSTGYLKDFLGSNSITGLVVGSFSSLIELLVLMAIFFAIDSQRKYLKNQKELITAQLRSLQMQMHPHFLFNTLHSIASMIDIDSREAQRMITKMGSLMRTILEKDSNQMVSLESELQFIKDYLDLEQIRHQDRLKISYDISEPLLGARIPNMILQPLVENAIKFGILPDDDEGQIKIKIDKAEKHKFRKGLRMEVSNKALETARTNRKGTGVGLINIKNRLRNLYGSNFDFAAKFVSPSLYVATVIIPINDHEL